jgi:hypothetical protein
MLSFWDYFINIVRFLRKADYFDLENTYIIYNFITDSPQLLV